MVPLPSHKVPRVSWYFGSRSLLPPFGYAAFTLLACFPKTVLLGFRSLIAVRTPARTRAGLGSSHFARRYFGNRVFFLFLRVLRCFSSPGSLHEAMYLLHDTMGLPWWVSPFGDLRIVGYLRLPEAFRSLSRPSSALSAKASALRSL